MIVVTTVALKAHAIALFFLLLIATCDLPLATCHLPLAPCPLPLAPCHLPLARTK